MMAADGRTVWLHNVVSVKTGPNGSKHLTGVTIDVTNRKMAETGLKESEEPFQLVFERSTAGIVITDASGRILRANKSFCDLIRFSDDELRGRSVLDITHAGDREVTRAYLEHVHQDRAPVYDMEKRYVRRDGEVVYVRISVVCVRTGVRDTYLISVVQDISERKRSEELLRDSEERFRTIFENAGVGTSLVDRHGHPIKCNPAVQKMLGYSESELRNMVFTEFTHPDDIDLDWKLYSELVAGKRDKYEIEKRYIKKNGELMWGHLTVSLIRNRDGSPAEYTVGMVKDITERKRSEDLLRESEERFRTIFENAGLGVALVDWEGHPIKCNPALQRMLGYSESELRNMVFTEFTHPDDIELDWKLYRELADRKRDKYEIEKRYIKKNGEVMWGQLTVSQVKNKDGTLAKYMVGMVVDISERKRAEKQLRQSEERFRSLVEATSEVVWTAEAGPEAIEVAAWYEFTGQSPQEARDNWLAVVHPDDRQETEVAWLNFLKNGGVYEREHRVRRRDGEYRLLSARGVTLRENDGRIREWIGTFKDITEHKLAERELKVAYDLLTKELAERTRAEAEILRLSARLISAQEEERTRIARELHDDLSQQIAALGIALSKIKRQIPADQREVREQAARAYDRALTIGAGIRHLSHELHPAVIEHSGLIAALESYCAEFHLLTKVNTTLQAEGRCDDLPANTQLGIYRIAQEALYNIWKHAGVKEAAVSLARVGERVQMQISDRGVGFDPAQRSKEAGLGLISMRERARLLGGTFLVKSSLGGGTRITVDIPANPVPPAEPLD